MAGLSLIFPEHYLEQREENKFDDFPDEFAIHLTLFSLFKGDAEKMNYFYTNKTEADLKLWIILHNNTNCNE